MPATFHLSESWKFSESFHVPQAGCTSFCCFVGVQQNIPLPQCHWGRAWWNPWGSCSLITFYKAFRQWLFILSWKNPWQKTWPLLVPLLVWPLVSCILLDWPIWCSDMEYPFLLLLRNFIFIFFLFKPIHLHFYSLYLFLVAGLTITIKIWFDYYTGRIYFFYFFIHTPTVQQYWQLL